MLYKVRRQEKKMVGMKGRFSEEKRQKLLDKRMDGSLIKEHKGLGEQSHPQRVKRSGKMSG